jgi:N-acetyl-anhydromuramyl-L-alanine amidase AmpD
VFKGDQRLVCAFQQFVGKISGAGREGVRASLCDSLGLVHGGRVRLERKLALERGPMSRIRGIIVHQTGGPTAESTLASYNTVDANGAHFLIDRDGAVYQTASVFKKTPHVGKLKARCLLEQRCLPVEVVALSRFNPRAENMRERTKEVPDRFPSNDDSIGIELVAEALPRDRSVPSDKKTYEAVTAAQNHALEWLVRALRITLGVPMTEVFRHPTVARKNPTEASTARW